jgi:hypothetical protein
MLPVTDTRPSFHFKIIPSDPEVKIIAHPWAAESETNVSDSVIGS